MTTKDSWARKRPLSIGFALMFLLTWPVELWSVASSRGWVTTGPRSPANRWPSG
ncbi:MAG TPA: hypothetical protein PKE46_07455 [Micropruina sp.]|nr:hypothetical protein [Micropruina sp.]HMR21956.1 hypothetical protein [Micropruina sp.]